MSLKKVAGSKIFIGSPVLYKDTILASDFTSQAWLQIKGWIEAGEMGIEQEILTQLLIDSGITHYGKGALSFPQMTNVFVPNNADPGQIAFKDAIKGCGPYAFKIEWGADCGKTSPVTISTSGVVSLANHGLVAGTPITFATTGALPTGMTAGTQYYVSATGITAGTFSVSATPGGTAIVATAAGSGNHTATSTPLGDTDLFFGLALPGVKSGGDASANRTQNFNIQPIAMPIEI